MAEKFYAEGEHHRTRRITYNVTEGEFQRMVAVARAFDLSNSKFSRQVYAWLYSKNHIIL